MIGRILRKIFPAAADHKAYSENNMVVSTAPDKHFIAEVRPNDPKGQATQASIKRATWLAAWSAFLAFIAGSFYATISYRQMELLQIANKQAKTRPWMVSENGCITQTLQIDNPKYNAACKPSPFRVLDEAKAGQSITVVVAGRNAGQSIAFDAQMEGHWCIVTTPGKPSFAECRDGIMESGSGPRPSLDLPPNAQGSSNMDIYTTFRWDTRESNKWKMPYHQFYVVGKITYFDEGHGGAKEATLHTADFCYFYEPHFGVYPLRLCGNRADEPEKQSQNPN